MLSRMSVKTRQTNDIVKEKGAEQAPFLFLSRRITPWDADISSAITTARGIPPETLQLTITHQTAKYAMFASS